MSCGPVAGTKSHISSYLADCPGAGCPSSDTSSSYDLLNGTPEIQGKGRAGIALSTTHCLLFQSNAYILNAVTCLYESMFRSGALSADALRTLTDSVQYGIDAANDDLEVKSIQRQIQKVKKIYAQDRTHHPFIDEDEELTVNHETVTGLETDPLEVEWGFLQLRHRARVDSNTGGIVRWFHRVGELIGIKTMYRKTYRKIEELVAFSVVHSDIMSHCGPESLETNERLVRRARSILADELRRASPRDFYLIQHVMAAKILINIQRKVLEDLAREGSLSLHSVHELDEEYLQSQLRRLGDYRPTRPAGTGRMILMKKPTELYAEGKINIQHKK